MIVNEHYKLWKHSEFTQNHWVSNSNFQLRFDYFTHLTGSLLLCNSSKQSNLKRSKMHVATSFSQVLLDKEKSHWASMSAHIFLHISRMGTEKNEQPAEANNNVSKDEQRVDVAWMNVSRSKSKWNGFLFVCRFGHTFRAGAVNVACCRVPDNIEWSPPVSSIHLDSSLILPIRPQYRFFI